MSENTQIMYAAFAATPRRDNETEFDWLGRVAQMAQTIKVNSDPEHSTIMKAISQVDSANPNVSGFKGTITDVELEKASTRLIVTFYTGTDRERDDCEPGYEKLRTERTDRADGKAMARTVLSLIGHKVIALKEVESFTSGKTSAKVRVLRHIRDLGVDSDFEVEIDERTGRPIRAVPA